MEDVDPAELKLAIDIAIDLGAMPELLGELIEEELGDEYGAVEEITPWNGHRSDSWHRAQPAFGRSPKGLSLHEK